MSNKAKKHQEGTYTVNVKGNTIRVEKKIFTQEKSEIFGDYICSKQIGTYVRCAPEDEFSLVEGVKKVFERLEEDIIAEDKIKVGDKVKVINPLAAYECYSDWVINNIKDKNDMIRYDMGHTPDITLDYTVLCIAPHEENGMNLAYIKANNYTKECYLINIRGLKKA